MIGERPRHVPRYTDLPRDTAGAPIGWGVFGPDDALGRMNLQSADAVRAAASSVTRGAVFPLNAPHGLLDPPLFGRGKVRHTRIPLRGGAAFDDVYDNYYPQVSSQWDALSHEAYQPDAFYQGATAAEILRGERNGIEAWAQRGIAGRGVLLDVSRARSRNLAARWIPARAQRSPWQIWNSPVAGPGSRSDPVTSSSSAPDSWSGTSSRTKRPGRRWQRPGSSPRPGSNTPSQWPSTCGTAARRPSSATHRVWRCGPDLSERGAPFGYLHTILIGQFGLAIGELWWLADLAADCAADGRHDFLVTSTPVAMTGGIGSPANAMAIK
jgi:hypothetical protein